MPNKQLYSGGEGLKCLPARVDTTHKRECLFAAVKGLPERLATVVMLHAYGDNGRRVKQREIGKRLGVSRERVRQLLHEAYPRLRRAYESLLIHE